MESTFDASVKLILWLQSISTSLDPLFIFFTHLGDEVFYLLLLPLVYWTMDRKTGLRLTIVFLCSAYINTFAKVMFEMPRPFQYDPKVKMTVHAGGYGFPSGHTQNSVTVWTFLASCYKKTWFWIVALIMMIMIPFSRVYLGVHFPVDLLGGYILGFSIVLVFLRVEPLVSARLATLGLAMQIILSVSVPAFFILVFPGGDKTGITTMATSAGALVGLALERRFIGFAASGSLSKKALRFFIGLVFLAVIYLGLKIAFHKLEPEPLFRIIRYGLVGFFVSFGGPLFFVKTRLAPSEH